MLKVTSTELYELRAAARDIGLEADVYFMDQLGCPADPIAWAPDRQGIMRKLVVWHKDPSFEELSFPTPLEILDKLF